MKSKKQHIIDFVFINFGLLLVALGIYFFKIPNNFAIGGTSGIAIILSYLSPNLSVGPLLFIINGALVILGFLFIGVKFTSQTIYSSFMLSAMVAFLEKAMPIQGSITGDAMLDLIFAVLLPGMGTAIVFDRGASTGGTDILAKILNKYMHMNIGMTLLMSDFAITVVAGAIFGPRIGLYSILGLFVKGFLVDLMIESINLHKQVVIVSEYTSEIKKFILDNIKRSATIHQAYGAYTSAPKEVITTICTKRQAVLLRNYIREIDKNAFLSITNTSEIVGHGFRNVDM